MQRKRRDQKQGRSTSATVSGYNFTQNKCCDIRFEGADGCLSLWVGLKCISNEECLNWRDWWRWWRRFWLLAAPTPSLTLPHCQKQCHHLLISISWTVLQLLPIVCIWFEMTKLILQPKMYLAHQRLPNLDDQFFFWFVGDNLTLVAHHHHIVVTIIWSRSLDLLATAWSSEMDSNSNQFMVLPEYNIWN